MRSFGLRTLLLLLILSACGAFKTTPPSRSTASITDSQDNLIQDLEDKLDQIHIYQVIGQKQLYLFDEQIESTEIENIYDRPAYLKLQVIRTQVDELEQPDDLRAPAAAWRRAAAPGGVPSATLHLRVPGGA